MTKEEFYERVNIDRYPKYVFDQIQDGTPENDCAAIVCTESDKILLAKYEDGKWRQAHFTSPSRDYCGTSSQSIYYADIKEDIIYWTDGDAKDYSRKQRERKI